MATSLKRQMASGIAWTAVQKYSGIVIATIISMILSRLLTPKDFGVVGIAGTLVGFLNIFSDLGLGVAVVQRKDLTKDDISSIFSVTAYIGIILGSIFFIGARPVANFYNDTQLVNICHLMSIGMLFSSLNVVPNALLLKEKRFKFIALRTLIIQIILGILSIFAALAGAGIYALMFDSVFSGILVFIVTYRIYKIKFTLKINMKPIKEIASYSLFQFGFGVINYFTRNLDNLLIGKFINLKELGYYQKSYNIMLLPVQNITHVITPVLFPVLSDYQNNINFIKEKYNVVLKILSTIGFPISVMLFFCAKEIIIILFGAQWTPAVMVFKLLAVTIGFQIIGSTVGSVYQATNSTNWLFLVGLINTTINVIILIIALTTFKTIEAVAWGWIISTVISMWNWPYMYHVLFHSSCWSMVKSVTPGIAIALVLVIILLPVSYLTNNFNLFLSLIIKLIICFTITAYMIQRFGIFDVKKLLNNVIIKIKGKRTQF